MTSEGGTGWTPLHTGRSLTPSDSAYITVTPSSLSVPPPPTIMITIESFKFSIKVNVAIYGYVSIISMIQGPKFLICS